MKILNRGYAVGVCKRSNDQINFNEMLFRIIPNGTNYWVADPFPFERNGILYIFGEVFEYGKLKGSIGYTKLEHGEFSPWKIVISEDYHLSFPYIFESSGELFICPESHANKTLDLYKCISFPDYWVKDKTLANNIDIVDTVFFKYNGVCYGLGCAWKNLTDHKLQLFKFESDNLVISNGNLSTLEYYYSRPAGKIYFDDRGNSFMVSQICKDRYGQGLIFKSFDIQWPNYSEKEEIKVFPQNIRIDKKINIDGIHTFNTTENYVVIDVLWSRFNFVEKFYRIKRKAMRFL